MWANTEVRDFAQWLRDHNTRVGEPARQAGFYGMDVYSLHASADAVVRYLERVDPAAARRARQRYAGFARFREEPEAYGLATVLKPEASSERAVREQFEELQRRYTSAAPAARTPELFSALQNARVARNAEEYYRTMHGGAVSSWNLRDKHMAETLDALAAHLGMAGKPARIVVWAHNSHVGDARHTSMGEAGEWNVGQLMRERHGDRAVLIGFTTYTGTVMAASAWGERGKVQRVLPALPGSFSALFHDTGTRDFLLLLRGNREIAEALDEPRLERAIGVVYLPQTERESHYFQARMSKQFDAVIHFDETRAVTPLRP
jgi:erythromycin esterase-like protein